ncbi:MAG: response regulator [Bernardetiaceae bacterium]
MKAKKILIAEDSAVVQNIVRRILQAQQFEIDTARDGQEVLQKIETNDYAAILMDINMPKMNGLDCAQRIRAHQDPKRANIPIIAITGNPDNYSLDDFQRMGINDLVEKPINFDLLTQKLLRICNV